MSKYERNRVFILNDPNAPRLSPQLAAEIGLNESILLLQLEFLIAVSDHEVDGKRWTYQSVTDLEGIFPFWGRATINRIIHSLQRQGLIVVGNHNKHRYDKTRWFALDEHGVSKLESITLCLFHNGTRSAQNGTGSNQNGTTIPETTTENTTDDTAKNKQGESWRWMQAIGEVCGIDVKMKSNKGQVSRYAKELREAGYTVEQVNSMYGKNNRGSWWYNNDWRGKQNQAPSPADIVKTIAQAVKDTKPVVMGSSLGGNMPMIGAKRG